LLYELSDSARADYKRLTDGEKQIFKEAALEFSAACDRWILDHTTAWPGSLRVKPVQGAAGVLEMTWSFSGPDGRATWEWCSVLTKGADGVETREPAVRWRRIGNHQILRSP